MEIQGLFNEVKATLYATFLPGECVKSSFDPSLSCAICMPDPEF